MAYAGPRRRRPLTRDVEAVAHAAEHVAGADRVPRGKTWAIFMLLMLLALVLTVLAAAQLERSAALSSATTTCTL